MAQAILPRKEETGDTDSRPLAWPIKIKADGREHTMSTLGHAAVFLTHRLPHLAAQAEWQRANDALMSALEDCTEGKRDLATRLIEHVCRTEKILVS
jgi:hypothetical protein